MSLCVQRYPNGSSESGVITFTQLKWMFILFPAKLDDPIERCDAAGTDPLERWYYGRSIRLRQRMIIPVILALNFHKPVTYGQTRVGYFLTQLLYYLDRSRSRSNWFQRDPKDNVPKDKVPVNGRRYQRRLLRGIVLSYWTSPTTIIDYDLVISLSTGSHWTM